MLAGGARRSLPERFRAHADSLTRGRRSPLSAELMRRAAADLEADGVVARLLAGIDTPPGSVPQLRLLAALHHLVLAGRAPDLAAFYPSAGGTIPPEGAWSAAEPTLTEHFAWIKNRLTLSVQTNEPGRSTVLYAALLWLVGLYRLPVRLLEIGASAGLNLIPDRYCYFAAGRALGDPSSAVAFHEPWEPATAIALGAAGGAPEIVRRAGCDRHPLHPRDPEDRTTLLSYIWPDELERIERMRAALAVAADSPPQVDRDAASQWLGPALAERGAHELTVIWQSVFRQYVNEQEWTAIGRAVEEAAGRASRGAPGLADHGAGT